MIEECGSEPNEDDYNNDECYEKDLNNYKTYIFITAFNNA